MKEITKEIMDAANACVKEIMDNPTKSMAKIIASAIVAEREDCVTIAKYNYPIPKLEQLKDLVFAGRRAFETGSLPDEEQRNLDLALEKFSAEFPYEDEPCEYCSSGAYSGLPGGACESCMGTGLKHNGD